MAVQYDAFGNPVNYTGTANQSSSQPATGYGATNFPYINPNSPQQNLPLTQMASQTPANPANTMQPLQGQQSVQATAQQPQQQATQQPQQPSQTKSIADQALQQLSAQASRTAQQDPLADLVTAQTQQYMLDPMMGFDPDQYTRQAMAQYDTDRAKAFEAARQAMAPGMQSGVVQQELLGNMLQGRLDRQSMEADLTRQGAEMKQRSAIQALAEGRAGADVLSQIGQRGVQNLATLRGATEGELTRDMTVSENALERLNQIALKNLDNEGQMAVASLRGTIEQGLQASQQQWAAAQEALNRDLERTMQTTQISADERAQMVQIRAQQIMQQTGIDAEAAMQQAQIDADRQIEELRTQSVRENLETQLAFDRWKTESGYQFTEEQNALNRALETSLKTMDVDSQMAIAELKTKADKDLLITQQEYESTMQQLQIAADKELAAGNWQNALEVVELRGTLEERAAQNQREWQSRQSQIDRDWRSREALDDRTHQKLMQQIDYQLQEARASNDAVREQELLDKQAFWDLKMQTNSMTHDESMAYLNSRLQDTAAQRDFSRQKQLLEFQYGQEMEQIFVQQGHDEMMQQYRFLYDQALQRNDIVAQQALQNQRVQIESDRWAKEFAYRENFDQYNAVLEQVEAGAISPEEGVRALTQLTGDTYQVQDSYQQAVDAIKREYDLMRVQFAETASQDMLNQDGTLNSAGEAAFDEHINETLWNQGGIESALGVNPSKGDFSGVPALPTFQVSSAGLGDIDEFYSSPEFNQLRTNEDFQALVQDNPRYRVDISIPAPLFYDSGYRPSSEFRSEWNNSLGRFVNIGGKEYIVYGINNGRYRVKDPITMQVKEIGNL